LFVLPLASDFAVNACGFLFDARPALPNGQPDKLLRSLPFLKNPLNFSAVTSAAVTFSDE
jgi:hypothetical protein